MRPPFSFKHAWQWRLIDATKSEYLPSEKTCIHIQKYSENNLKLPNILMVFALMCTPSVFIPHLWRLLGNNNTVRHTLTHTHALARTHTDAHTHARTHTLGQFYVYHTCTLYRRYNKKLETRVQNAQWPKQYAYILIYNEFARLRNPLTSVWECHKKRLNGGGF